MGLIVFATKDTICIRLEENLIDLGWSKGDIISLTSLEAIMRIYAEVKITIICIQ